jgi:hypothetical protein
MTLALDDGPDQEQKLLGAVVTVHPTRCMFVADR